RLRKQGCGVRSGAGLRAPEHAGHAALGEAVAVGVQPRIRLAVRPVRLGQHRRLERREPRPLQPPRPPPPPPPPPPAPFPPPPLGLRFDFARGDNDPNSPNLQTFNPLFPSGIYFNLLNPVGPLNMIDLPPTLDLYAGEKVTVSFDWDFFWRESLGDGVYRISGVPLRTGVGGGRYVGNSPAVTVVWNATRHLSVLTHYVHFFPRSYFPPTPP